jgi:hypothetical protein
MVTLVQSHSNVNISLHPQSGAVQQSLVSIAQVPSACASTSACQCLEASAAVVLLLYVAAIHHLQAAADAQQHGSLDSSTQCNSLLRVNFTPAGAAAAAVPSTSDMRNIPVKYRINVAFVECQLRLFRMNSSAGVSTCRTGMQLHTFLQPSCRITWHRACPKLAAMLATSMCCAGQDT